MNILLAGYYGFGNLGDELILSTLIGQIQKRYNNASICVLSAVPGQTTLEQGVPALSRWSFSDVVTSIWKADLFVLGGGGLLQNKTSNRSLLYYLSLVALARLFRCHVVLYAMGVETISGTGWEWALHFLLKSPRVKITVRDDKSKDILVKMGIPSGSIHLTADPVFGRPASPPPNGGFVSEQPTRSLLIPRFPIPHSDQKIFENLTAVLIEEMHIAVKGALFQPETEWPFLRRSSLQNLPLVDNCCIRKGAEALQEFDFIVSARFHGLVLAALAGRPFIGVGDNDKIRRLCESFGMPFLAWGSGREEIRSSLRLILSADRPQIDQALVEKARNAAEKNIEHLAVHNFINIPVK